MGYRFETGQQVLTRTNDHGMWRYNIFSHLGTFADGSVAYHCLNGTYEHCIPYEGNEIFIGTTNSPPSPELEFRFGDHVEVKEDGSLSWIKARFVEYCENPNYPFKAYVEDGGIDLYKYCRRTGSDEQSIDTTDDNPPPPEPEFRFGDAVEVRDLKEHPWQQARFIRFLKAPIYKYTVYFDDTNLVETYKHCRKVD